MPDNLIYAGYHVLKCTWCIDKLNDSGWTARDWDTYHALFHQAVETPASMSESNQTKGN